MKHRADMGGRISQRPFRSFSVGGDDDEVRNSVYYIRTMEGRCFSSKYLNLLA